MCFFCRPSCIIHRFMQTIWEDLNGHSVPDLLLQLEPRLNDFLR